MQGLKLQVGGSWQVGTWMGVHFRTGGEQETDSREVPERVRVLVPDEAAQEFWHCQTGARVPPSHWPRSRGAGPGASSPSLPRQGAWFPASDCLPAFLQRNSPARLPRTPRRCQPSRALTRMSRQLLPAPVSTSTGNLPAGDIGHPANLVKTTFGAGWTHWCPWSPTAKVGHLSPNRACPRDS